MSAHAQDQPIQDETRICSRKSKKKKQRRKVVETRSKRNNGRK